MAESKYSTNTKPSSSYAAKHARLDPQHEKLLIDSGIDPEVARERVYFTEQVKANLKGRGFSPIQCPVSITESGAALAGFMEQGRISLCRGASAYDVAALKHFGEFARPNFPRRIRP